jgi:D-arabinose 1-dehydrogenase-like Zn-dependent alcohol dehydrogenase
VGGSTVVVDGGALAAGAWMRLPDGGWTHLPIIAADGYDPNWADRRQSKPRRECPSPRISLDGRWHLGTSVANPVHAKDHDSDGTGTVMRAVLCHAFAPRSQLRLEETADPAVEPGQVLIGVEACGINFFDGLVVEGKYQTRPDRPFSPGSEVAGTVLAVADDVTAVRPGMRVLAFAGFGGYAEKTAVDAARVFPIPDPIGFAEAAAFLITYATSYHALKDRAAIEPGETLLVLGAAGGVGLTAVELGRLMGARVIAAASRDEKQDLCRA